MGRRAGPASKRAWREDGASLRVIKYCKTERGGTARTNDEVWCGTFGGLGYGRFGIRVDGRLTGLLHVIAPTTAEATFHDAYGAGHAGRAQRRRRILWGGVVGRRTAVRVGGWCVAWMVGVEGWAKEQPEERRDRSSGSAAVSATAIHTTTHTR